MHGNGVQPNDSFRECRICALLFLNNNINTKYKKKGEKY
jgi:hypothetical protein